MFSRMKFQAVVGVALMIAAGWGANRIFIEPLKSELRTAKEAVLQAREAQRVSDAYVDGANKRAAKLNSRIEAALTETYGGCADAPIDPDLLRDVGGL